MRLFRRIMLGSNFEAEETQKIYYTATAKVTPASGSLGSTIIQNNWNSSTGEGVIICLKDIILIGGYAFSGCTSLISITIPENVTSIGAHAFEDCSSLVSITIPNGVTEIGYHAFYECSSLTSITIPESVTKMGSGAFEYCSSLTSVYITDIAAWCGIDFGNYSATPLWCADNLYLNGELVTDLVIPDSVTSIRDGAFRSYSSLASVTIGNSVISIGSYAFNGCSSLTNITIPNSITEIGYHTFSGCSSLTSITIPESVTKIGSYAFYGSRFASMYCKPITPPTLGLSAVSFDASGSSIYVPTDSVDTYKAATNWSKYADYIVGYDFDNETTLE